jgi:hypothetical protein
MPVRPSVVLRLTKGGGGKLIQVLTWAVGRFFPEPGLDPRIGLRSLQTKTDSPTHFSYPD